MFTSPKIQARLQNAHPVVFSLFVIAAAFCTYSCMYMFRKPFAVGTYEGLSLGALEFKSILIISQVVGYALSKFIGIKVISEMTSAKRALAILVLIGISWIALLGFALTPYPYNFPWLFFNGMPLGMVWGLVFSFLEGRKTTEVLGAGLSVSFIFASGFAKSVGKWLMSSMEVPEFWMPFATGAIFVVPLVFFVWMLDQIPPPSAEDVASRTKREPMNGAQRAKFFKTFAPGLILLIVVYVLLTAYRDFRDNFAVEIWESLGYGDQPDIFTTSEIPVMVGVLLMVGIMMLIKNNLRAFMLNHVLIGGGLLLAGGATLAFEAQLIGPVVWMVLSGLGLYMGYVPFNCIMFDRLIATFKYISNAGFLIYVADSFGYLGSVSVLLFKDFGAASLSWVDFFILGGYFLSVVGVVFIAAAGIYFWRKAKTWEGGLQNPQ
ncbi:MAG: hypothetical protein H6581_03220 [Bacteroidia bacterium]|nr:hypothetical protein [Bacteroidia bacterium]